MSAPHPVFSNAHVRGEKVHHGIHVSHVQRQRILRRQLTNVIKRLEPIQARNYSFVRHFISLINEWLRADRLVAQKK
jgi:hypothetical protein